MQKILSYFIALLLIGHVANAQDTLYIYGPGGPYGPMKQCADTFSKQVNKPVKVTAGPEGTWINQALQNADLVFGGAEYMMDDFIQRHPGFMDTKSRTSVSTRAGGILVRPGNPKRIRSVVDLGKPGIRIMITTQAGQTGMWEELAIKAGKLPEVQKNIYAITSNSAQAIDKWKTDVAIDAWITYASWYYRLKDITALVPVPLKENISRGTPVAIVNNADQKDLAAKFIHFLLTDEAKRIFRKLGWNYN